MPTTPGINSTGALIEDSALIGCDLGRQTLSEALSGILIANLAASKLIENVSRSVSKLHFPWLDLPDLMGKFFFFGLRSTFGVRIVNLLRVMWNFGQG